MKTLAFIILCLLFACVCAHSTNQVVLSCGDDHNSVPERGLPGAPGKRGAVGPIGPKGPQGSKGEPEEEDDSWMEAYLQLNKSLTEVKQKLELVQSVKYVWREPRLVTWTGTKRFCEDIGRTLCNRSQIFPLNENVPLIGVQDGDRWAPINDIYRDWVEIGNHLGISGITGKSHINLFGVPDWGESTTKGLLYKGHVFCCAL